MVNLVTKRRQFIPYFMTANGLYIHARSSRNVFKFGFSKKKKYYTYNNPE